MKKLFVCFALMLAMSTSYADSAKGGESLPITIKPTNPDGEHTPLTKGPILVPVVYLDGHVLSFDESLEGCTVQLLDENENTVFADFIEENQTSVTFPSTLTGTYELDIVRGSITFYCYIEL